MVTKVNLGLVSARLKAVESGLSDPAFRGSAELVDNHIVLRAEVPSAAGARPEVHSEVIPLAQVFSAETDVLADALRRLRQWAGERVDPAA